FNHTDDSGSYTFSPSISGNGQLEHHAGTTLLTGTNSYTGITQMEGGALRAGSAGAFVPDGAYVINGGTLDLDGNGLTMSSLSGAGGTLDMGAAYVRINQRDETVYDGGMIATAGRLSKMDSGILTLNGQIGGLSNGLYVGNGTLAINNANSHGYTNLKNGAVLEVGHGQSLGTGQLTVVGSGTLRANTDLVLTNLIRFDYPGSNHLTVDGSRNLTLTGDFRAYDRGGVNILTKTGTGLLTLS